MEIIYIILAVIIVLNGVVAWLIFSRTKREEGDQGSNDFLLIQNQIQDLTKSLNERMDKNSESVQNSVHKQLESSQDILDRMAEQLKSVQKGLTESTESSKQVLTITEALQSLERTLKNQKTRGSLGEEGLKLILENILGTGNDLYEIQYRFSSGEVVDAVIKAKDGIICIDSKFSLDNYQRLIECTDEAERVRLEKEFKNDLKKRIDETSKYIKPSEGTLSFALMYIPAEGIYYDLLINPTGTGVNARSLLQYANDKNVIVVSPMTLYAYLHTILHGFNAFRIEKQTEEIKKNVTKLKENLNRFDEYHTKLGSSLNTVVNHYNASRKKFVHIDQNVFKITGASTSVEVIEVDKPQMDE